VAEKTPEKKSSTAAAASKAATQKPATKAATKTKAKPATKAATTPKAKPGIKPAKQGGGVDLKEVQKKVKTEIGPAVEKAGKGLKEAQQTLGDVLKATARATRKSARILGIKANIANQIRSRQKLFAQLGELYYKAQKKKTPAKSDEEALKAAIEEINQVSKKIRDLEAQEIAARTSS